MCRHLQVEYRPIDSVTPNARNARTHSKKQIRQLANSMRAYDFINPVLVDKKGELVAGHARLLAA
jgi:ParB-like chromosome segregation protein Spo0J